MKSWPHTTLRSKLMILTAVAVGAALLLVNVGLSYVVITSMHQTELESLRTQASIAAASCAAPMHQGDREGARRSLSALNRNLIVSAATLTDAQGQTFATFARHHESDAVGNQSPGPSSAQSAPQIEQTVQMDGKTVGKIQINVDTSSLQDRAAQYGKAAFTVTLAAMAAALLLAMLLQNQISRPIQQLCSFASSATGDQSAMKNSEYNIAEFAQLGQSLNENADRLQQLKADSDTALANAESQVADRVRHLESEVGRLDTTRLELERTREEAELTDRAKSRFLANMSHEIRSPLNGIIGFTHLLLKSQLISRDSREAGYLKTIESSVRHLLTIINDVLDISKIESGQIEIEQVECNVQAVIVEVMSMMRVQANEKGLKLEQFWGTRAPKVIQSDPARLRQMLVHLISNAIKFTDQGGVQVIAQLNDGCDKIIIDVIDTGLGIQESNLEQIFNPYAQPNNSDPRRCGGIGLGLAITRQLARTMGGDLTVHSTEGKGTKFTLEVSTGPTEQLEFSENANEAIAGAQPHQVHRLDGFNILVVEDGATNRELISIVLEESGACVSTAENGLLGVQAAQTGCFDAILMDMRMPVMDGYTATRTLRLEGCTTPIIAITAQALNGDEKKCLEAGCTSYLTKPIDPEVLLKDLSELLGASGWSAEADSKADVTITEPTQFTKPSALQSSLPQSPAFVRITDMFYLRIREQFASMDSALESDDWFELAAIAHWLKGSGGTAGYDEFTEPAKQLEQHAKDCDYIAARNQLQVIEQLIERLPATES